MEKNSRLKTLIKIHNVTGGKQFTVFPEKTVKTRENFWNVHCFVTDQKRDETAKDNRQTAAWISHDLIRNNELAFSSNELAFLPQPSNTKPPNSE